MAKTDFSHGNKYAVHIGVAEEANFLGEMYYTRAKLESVPVGEFKDIVIKVGEKDIFIVGRSFSITTDRLSLCVYSTPTYSGGTLMPVSPYNGITPVLPAKTFAWYDPTVTVTGSLFDEFLILGDPSSNPNNVGGTFRSDEIVRMIPAGGEFLLRFKNEGNIPMDGMVKYLFFERKQGRPSV